MLQIKKSDYQKLLNHAEANLPEEACGLIGGVTEGEAAIVKEVYLLTNIDHSNEHFSMDPKEQLSAVKDMRAKGYQLLGNWHSHPESPSRPSEEDKRLAHDSKALYLILSLMDRENPVLNAFHVVDHTDVSKEVIEYTE